MTNRLKHEIETHLTTDFFPCTAKDIEKYADMALNDVSDEFFAWAMKLSNQTTEDGYDDFKYNSVDELFPQMCLPSPLKVVRATFDCLPLNH
jgi:hypothetical protein